MAKSGPGFMVSRNLSLERDGDDKAPQNKLRACKQI
jgi:hypothetical protein